MSSKLKYRLACKRFNESLKYYEAGKRFYEKLMEKYGEDTYILLSPHASTGDAYLIAGFMTDYLKNEGIGDNYVYCAVSNTTAKLMTLFGIDNVIIINMEERMLLQNLLKFMGEDNCKLRLMHYCGIDEYQCILGNMRTCNGLAFNDMLAYGAFNLEKSDFYYKPNFADNSKYADELFNRYNLVKGKTVILAPVASSMVGLPGYFWEDLANKLINMGYCVATNLGSDKEQPLKNTVPLFFPLACAIDVAEAAGYFIGYRSGFCDIISSAKCNKVILYPERADYQFGKGTTLQYFGLKNMGLCEDAVEIEFSRQTPEVAMEMVMKNF